MKPSIGRIVHYVAYGTPGGEFPAGEHRAAIVTEISKEQDSESGTRLGLAVVNPTGLFFNGKIPEDQTATKPGTWHWPERDEASSVVSFPVVDGRVTPGYAVEDGVLTSD